jgi:hypothetical protein
MSGQVWVAAPLAPDNDPFNIQVRFPSQRISLLQERTPESPKGLR